MTIINNQITDLLKEIEKSSQKYNKYNFLKEMFNFSNERYLHSSFIAMLLSQEDRNRYLGTFLNQLSKCEDDNIIYGKRFNLSNLSLDKAIINPNKDDHREHKNIDILIRWEQNQEKTAIIIENKTFSGDRNKDGIPQLVSYAKKLEDEEKYQKENIYLVYLNFRGEEPTCKDEFKGYNLTVLGYDNFIKNWIVALRDDSQIDGQLKIHLNEYYLYLCENLDTAQNAINLKEELIGFLKEDTDVLKQSKIVIKAYKDSLQSIKECQDLLQPSDKLDTIFTKVLKDVKWHVIHEIITGIIKELQKQESGFDVIVDYRVLIDKINLVAKNDNSTAKIIIDLKYHDTNFYLCNDLNGFTVGKCINGGDKDFEQVHPDHKYPFRDFLKKPEVLNILGEQDEFISNTVQLIIQAVKRRLNK